MRRSLPLICLAFAFAACTQAQPVAKSPPSQPAAAITPPAAVKPVPAVSLDPAFAPWQAVVLPALEPKPSFKAVFFLDPETGWACGDHGLILSTTDAGRTWKKSDASSDATLRGILFIDKAHGFICGDGDPNSPPVKKGHIVFGHGEPMVYSTLLSTEDGGQTWKKRDIWTNFQLTSVATVDGKKIMLGNSGGEQHMDGDTIMLNEGKFGAKRACRALFGVAAMDEQHWAAVGSPVDVWFTPTPTDELYLQKHIRAIYSDDGGATWKIGAGSEGGVPLRAAAYRKDAGLLAVGDKGNIVASEDMGATWVKRDSPTDKPLRGVAWGSEKTVLAVGRGGAAVVSVDGGKTWAVVPMQKALTFNGVAAAGDAFVAVSNEGMILRAEARDLIKAAATQPAK